jgi:hypothetical protein
MKYITPILVAIAALAVSVTAAYYSITGLGALFAGASTAVIIMASALEFSKLVIASVLYRFWAELKIYLRIYLSIALFVLVVITSFNCFEFIYLVSSVPANASASVASSTNQLVVVVGGKTCSRRSRFRSLGSRTNCFPNLSTTSCRSRR